MMLPTSTSTISSFCVKSMALGGADLRADLALAACEVGAVGRIDHRNPRHGLRERHVDRLARGHADLEHVVDHFPRALLHADAAARAIGGVDHAGLLADLDLEVAHRSAHLFQLGVGEHRDLVVLADFGHLGREDAGRAVQRGEGLVELGHVPADRRLALDQVDRVAGVGQFQRGLQAGDAAADHERGRVDLHVHPFQRLLMPHPSGRRGDQGLGLLGGRFLVDVHPGAVLADVGHLQQVGIETGVLAGPAEGLLVQVRRAGGHDDARQALLLDVLFDQALAERRAHELVVAGDGHVFDVLARPARDLFHVDRAGDVAAAMTDVNADFLGHRCVPHRVPSTQYSVVKTRPQFHSVLGTAHSVLVLLIPLPPPVFRSVSPSAPAWRRPVLCRNQVSSGPDRRRCPGSG